MEVRRAKRQILTSTRAETVNLQPVSRFIIIFKTCGVSIKQVESEYTLKKINKMKINK